MLPALRHALGFGLGLSLGTVTYLAIHPEALETLEGTFLMPQGARVRWVATSTASREAPAR
jgi:hypothetical protein